MFRRGVRGFYNWRLDPCSGGRGVIVDARAPTIRARAARLLREARDGSNVRTVDG